MAAGSGRAGRDDRRQRGVVRRGGGGAPRPDRQGEPSAERSHQSARRGGSSCGEGSRRRARERRSARAASRRAVHGQAEHRSRGVSHRQRRPRVRRRDLARGRAGGRANEGGWRNPDRPHQLPRHGPARAHGLVPARPDSQPMGSDAHGRRVFGRRSLGSGVGDVAGRPRQRHRRLPPQPCDVLRHRVAQAVGGDGAGVRVPARWPTGLPHSS